MTARYVRARVGDAVAHATLEVTAPPSGGAIVSGHLIPPGKPNPLTSGWQGSGIAYGDLELHQGDFITSADNQRIIAKRITGDLIVAHKGVKTEAVLVGENSQTQIGAVRYAGGATGGQDLHLLYTEVMGPRGPGFTDTEGVRVFKPGLVIEKGDINNTADGAILVDGTVIIDTIIRDLHYESGSHSDCVQCSHGSGWLVQNCTLIANKVDFSSRAIRNAQGVEVIEDGYNAFANAAVQLGSQQGPIQGVVRNCYLSMGGYTLNANKVNEGTHGQIDVLYENNIMSGYFRHGPAASTGGKIILSNSNVWEATRKTYKYSTQTLQPNGVYNLIEGTPVPGTTSSPIT